MERWGDYWRFTTKSLARLLHEVFEPEKVEIATYGNVLSAAAFLYGLAAAEMDASELDAVDESYQVIVAASAVK
jgi:hypothetical protein